MPGRLLASKLTVYTYLNNYKIPSVYKAKTKYQNNILFKFLVSFPRYGVYKISIYVQTHTHSVSSINYFL